MEGVRADRASDCRTPGYCPKGIAVQLVVRCGIQTSKHSPSYVSLDSLSPYFGLGYIVVQFSKASGT
jgi:hypothetical protein